MRHEEGPRAKGAISEGVAGRRQGEDTSPLVSAAGTPPLLEMLESGDRSGVHRGAAGQRQAQHGEDVRIVGALEDEVRRLAAAGVEFTGDDVLPDLASRKALGSVFSRLAREGAIRCVGARKSARAERHGALTRVWVGTGRGGGADA